MRSNSAYEERFGYKEKGVFYCARKCELFKAILPTVILLPLALASLYCSLASIISAGDLLAGIEWLALAAGFVCILITILRIILKGREFYYEADDKELRIFRVKFKGEKILENTFYYVDVVNIDYKDMIPKRGLIVTITTKYREYKYRYVYHGSKRLYCKEESPFYILSERAKLLNKGQ